MLSHHNRTKRQSHPGKKHDFQQKQALQCHQNELFQAQKKLDLYRNECGILGDRIHQHEGRLNQHIEHYANWLAKRNLMVKALGREASASKALIARAEAACLRLETLVEGLRTGSREAQRRIFRIFKSQINRAVNQAVGECTKTILAEHNGDMAAFQEAHSGINPQGSGWHEREKKPAKTWIQAEQIVDQFNLNILQLERQVNLHRQSIIHPLLAADGLNGDSTKTLTLTASSPSNASTGKSIVHGLSHYAWMPSFYRSGVHFQIIAKDDSDKAEFLHNFLGWIEYNIPRANIVISQLSETSSSTWREANHLGVEGMMRQWNEFQGLMEARVRSQHQMTTEEEGSQAAEVTTTHDREYYALFDEYEQLLPYAPRGTGSEFRSALLAGDIPKMHLIFVSQSPECGTVELSMEHVDQIARIIIGESLIAALLKQQGRSLFRSQFKPIKHQFSLWKARAHRQPTDPQSGIQHRSFGLIELNHQWQFVLLPPPGYFVGKLPAIDNTTRIQAPDSTEIQFLDPEVS